MKHTRWIGIFDYCNGKAYAVKVEIDDDSWESWGSEEIENFLVDHGIRLSNIEWMAFDQKPEFEIIDPIK